MNTALSQELEQFLKDSRQPLIDLIDTLCKIPSPSNHEEQRAAFIKKWLEQQGASGVTIDRALNVLYPVDCEGKNDICVLMAHTDTVFPDTQPFTVSYEGNKMKCPGIGDDTTNLAMLMLSIQYIIKHKRMSDCGVLFVANSGEEGLGNLKGCRQIMKAYKGRIAQLVSFDGSSLSFCNRAVGSKRYRVVVKTEGGHSYQNFGNRNAIHFMSSMIHTLYMLKVPATGINSYNVGTISGGTSVNTIAQYAEMLCEYRSDHQENLDVMVKFFHTLIRTYRAMGISVEAELVGDRPCMGNVDSEKQSALEQKVIATVKLATGRQIKGHSSSTDCNIPFSLGIPAIAFGGYTGQGAHTREEYIELDSLQDGLKLILSFVLSHFKSS